MRGEQLWVLFESQRDLFLRSPLLTSRRGSQHYLCLSLRRFRLPYSFAKVARRLGSRKLPGMHSPEELKDLPPANVATCGFDLLRDVGVEYAERLDEAGNLVIHDHHPELTHRVLQFGHRSEEAEEATKGIARGIKALVSRCH
jgi:acetyl esterase/lipase